MHVVTHIGRCKIGKLINLVFSYEKLIVLVKGSLFKKGTLKVIQEARTAIKQVSYMFPLLVIGTMFNTNFHTSLLLTTHKVLLSKALFIKRKNIN